MAFYQTKLQSVGLGTARDVQGRQLRFIGNFPCQEGDTVWTDGAVIFGHVPVKPEPLILSEDGGIPVLSDYLRGYFTDKGKYKKYNIALGRWLTNSKQIFKHGTEKDADIFDAEILTDDNDACLVKASNAGVYTGGSDPNVYLSMGGSDTVAFALQGAATPSYEQVDQLIKSLPANVTCGSIRSQSQLLTFKLDRDQSWEAIVGGYAKAAIDFNHEWEPTPPLGDEMQAAIGLYSRDEFLQTDFFWQGGRYRTFPDPPDDDSDSDSDSDADSDSDSDSDSETYIARGFEDLPRNYYSPQYIQQFRLDCDTRLKEALVAFWEEAAAQPVKNVEMLSLFEPPSTPVSGSIEAFNINHIKSDGPSELIRSFYVYDTEIDLDQGVINYADYYYFNFSWYADNEPEEGERIRYWMSPAMYEGVITNYTSRDIKAIGFVAFIDTFPYNSDLDGSVIARLYEGRTLNGGVLTYQVFPVNWHDVDYCDGVIYLFFRGGGASGAAGLGADGFVCVLDVSFDDDTKQTYSLSLSGKYTAGHSEPDEGEFCLPVQDGYYSKWAFDQGYPISYPGYLEGIYDESDNTVVDSLSLPAMERPEGAAFDPIPNLSLAPLGKGGRNGYLVGVHGGDLYKVKNNEEEWLDAGLSNYRLRKLKNITKALK